MFGLHSQDAPEDPGVVPFLVARLSAPSASERMAAARRLSTARLGILPSPVALDAARKIFARVAEEEDGDAARQLYDAVSFLQWSDIGETAHAWEALGRAKVPQALGRGPGFGLFDDSAIDAATKLSMREDAWGDAALVRLSAWSENERAPAAVCERLAKATERPAGKQALARSACEAPVLTFLGAVSERGQAGTADEGDARASGQACILVPYDLDSVLAKASRDAEPTVAAEAKQAIRSRAAVKKALRGTGTKR